MKSKRKLKSRLTALASALCCTLAAQSSILADDDYTHWYHGTHWHHGWYKKPNIIVITADDYGAISSEIYNPQTEDPDFPQAAPTPSLATLAEHGVVFKNGWAMPVCSTTRGTITLGKLPTTSGIGGVIGGGTPYPDLDAGEPFPDTMVDPTDENTLQKLAQKKGYRTYKVGKWHEIAQVPNDPDGSLSAADVELSGFDVFYGQLGGFPAGGYGGSCGGDDPETVCTAEPDTWTPVSNDPGLNNEPIEEFLTSALVSRSIELIDGNWNDQPFFLRLDFPGPHWPYEVAPGPGEPCPFQDEADKGDPAAVEFCEYDWLTLDEEIHANVIQQVREAFDADPNDGVLDPYPPAGRRAPFGGNIQDGDRAKSRAAFKSLISYVDLQIGRLLKHVDLKHTTIFFLGDNGTQGGGGANNDRSRNNVVEAPWDPLKTKSSVYRGGPEVPFIVAGKSVKKKGRRSNAPVSSTDVYATVLDLIGQKQPKDTRRDSISFKRVLKGKKGIRRYNVAEWFGMYRSVGGLQGVTANEGRVVGTKDFRLQARPVQGVSNGVRQYLCQDDSLQGSTGDPATGGECLNPATGIYEKVYYLFFFDLRNDPLEETPLLIDEMSWKQRRAFRQHCWALNRVARNATFTQNGKVCEFDGSNLAKQNPGLP